MRVAVLETATPWTESLRQAGIDIDIYGWKRLIDVEPFFALRRLLKADRPGVVHAFGMTALRALQLCGVRGLRVVGSDLLHGGHPLRGWILNGWLLPGSGRVLAFGAAEALRYRRGGVAAKRIVQATPGVEWNEDTVPVRWPGHRVILGVGPIAAHKGFRDAVWAFDILHYLFDDLRLAFVGDGPDRWHVGEFAQAIGVTKWLSFLGKQPTVEPFLGGASIVWVPSRTAGGVCAALEAMAAQRPVVATRSAGVGRDHRGRRDGLSRGARRQGGAGPADTVAARRGDLGPAVGGGGETTRPGAVQHRPHGRRVRGDLPGNRRIKVCPA